MIISKSSGDWYEKTQGHIFWFFYDSRTFIYSCFFNIGRDIFEEYLPLLLAVLWIGNIGTVILEKAAKKNSEH